ncbi:MAG: rRNA pseudouridine synthase [Pirellulales bacterium]|nr:rRNA pseudouridine synthase [Pirellulales bacterium]
MQRRTRPKSNRQSKPVAARDAETQADEAGAMRLQKAMAAAGVGSRRKCEELILAGRVEVDGQAVSELGAKVNPERQEIHVDGALLDKARLVYYLVNKPVGVVTTNFDPSGRPRVIDLVPPGRERVFAVGRLDRSSEGLILVTNDGELADQLTHPRYGVEKTYQVIVAGAPTPVELEQLVGGVRLAEGVARAERVAILSQHQKSTQLEIVLREGKNREIRRLLAKIGHKVLKLKRVGIGRIKVKGLPLGTSRRLTAEEVDELRAAVRRGKKPRDPASTPSVTSRVRVARGVRKKVAAAQAAPHVGESTRAKRGTQKGRDRTGGRSAVPKGRRK